MLASNFRFSFVVRLLQAISTVWHRHGESTAQTAGCLWSLRRPAEQPEPQLHGRMIAKKKNPGETLMDHVERIRERAETTGTPLCCTRWRQRIQRSPRQMNVVFFLIYVVFVGRLGLLPKKKERTFFTRLARKWLQKAAVSETPVEFSSRGFSRRRLLPHPRPPYSGANVDFFPMCWRPHVACGSQELWIMLQPESILLQSPQHLYFIFFYSLQRSVATAKTIIPARCWNLFNRLSFHH